MAFCSNCGNNVNEGAVFCAQCGTKILQNSNQGNSQRGEKSSPDYFARERPYADTRGIMIWSIVNCFLCLPVAIYSILKLNKVNKANTQTEAKAIYRTAKISCIIASAIGGLFIIIFTTSLQSHDNSNKSGYRYPSNYEMMIRENEERYEEEDEDICPQCENTGERICYGCNGSGYNRYDNRLECNVCGGRGTVPCPALTCPLKR